MRRFFGLPSATVLAVVLLLAGAAAAADNEIPLTID